MPDSAQSTLLLAMLVVISACGTSTEDTAVSTPATEVPSPGGSVADDVLTIAPEAADATNESIIIRLRPDRRVDDAATQGFAEFVRDTLTDNRGWGRAGFEFTFDDTDFDYTIVLAEGPEVDELCLPYETYGLYSCQIGPIVALNADRWRYAVEEWPASLNDYRAMLVNHEVGHLLGQHHPGSRCPREGMPAPVMAQQSSGVDPCTANPWPLAWEVTCASQDVEPLAPPYERDITLTCGPEGAMD